MFKFFLNMKKEDIMLINLIQPKHGIQMESQTNLNVYCGKLKK
ncbi:MAG: hypothetical protein ACN23H_00505 [Candidatus Phytoplasma vitis]